MSIYVSDSRIREAATRQIRRGDGDGLAALTLQDAELLNAAFVRGPTRTIWLSGIHAPVSVKADSKILSGLDLRDALDPLGDQSYYFTAARSSVPTLRIPVGVSPRGARVWLGATSNWDDFVKTVADLLNYVEATTERDTQPLSALAVPAMLAPALAKAYEIRFLPPELLADDPTSEPEMKQMMERWAYRTDLEILKTHEDSLEVRVDMDGVCLGTLTLIFDTADVANVKIKAKVTPPDPACPVAYQDYVEESKAVSKKTGWIKVWYQSGHTLTDRAIFEVRYRDEPFDGFHWCDFKDYEITTEKSWGNGPTPTNPDSLGTKKSLFDWVWNNWPPSAPPYTGTGGWLACDDGPMEIADFVHLDVGGGKPVLTQIHVKGSRRDSATRGISVRDYEQVTSQAVKNLRHLDRLHMGDGLTKGLKKKIGNLLWHDRSFSTRKEMLRAIDQIKTSYLRMVVILQPSVRRSMLEEVHKANSEGKLNGDTGRVRQLNTLLLSAQASCRSLSAELWVLADKA